MNTDLANKRPIFIHSLFRAGSTYLFKVFRRSTAGYWCYQEPVHEIVLASKDNPHKLLDYVGEKMAVLRHPQIDRSYFWEPYEIYPKWKDAIVKEIIYDQYFDEQGDERLKNYLEILISSAKGRPVIQECRTANRITVIKKMLGGTHIFLWRNPWDQWWSYKVDAYFDSTNLLILNANPCRKVIESLRQIVDFKGFHSPDIFAEFSFFDQHPLSSENSYLVFYALWCLGIVEGNQYADLLINIDALSDRPAYRQSKIEELAQLGIVGIDFSDAHVAQTYYGERDKAFFTKIENRVHEMLLSNGYTQEQIDTIIALRNNYAPLIWQMTSRQIEPKLILENAMRARESVSKIETRESDLLRHFGHRLQEAEERAKEAEVRLAEAENRALKVEKEGREAEGRARKAEQKAKQLFEQTQNLHNELQQAEARAKEAEVRLAEAENRALKAEQRASNAEQKAMQLDQRVQGAEARAKEAEQKAKQLFEQTQNLHNELQEVYNSESWRITKPLRIAGCEARHISYKVVDASKKIITPSLVTLIRYVKNKPALQVSAKQILSYFPKIDVRLRRFAANRGLTGIGLPPETAQSHRELSCTTDLSSLSPRARRIYADLKAAIAKQQKGGN